MAPPSLPSHTSIALADDTTRMLSIILSLVSLALGWAAAAVVRLLPFAVGALVLAAFLSRCLAYSEQLRLVKASGAMAIVQSVFSLTTLPSAVLQSSFLLGVRFTVGTDWIWEGKFAKYAEKGCDIICMPSFMSSPSYFVANKESLRRMNLDRTSFRKPTQMYKVLDFFGKNLVTVEGDDWHRHRSIVKTSFAGGAYPLVWDRTKSIVAEMTREEGWDGLATGSRISLPHIHSLTLRVALVVIAEAGFGLSLPWSDKQTSSETAMGGGASVYDGADHSASSDFGGGWCDVKFTVQEALRIVATNTLIRAALPRPFFWLPFKKLWKVDRAFNQLEQYLTDMIAVRRARILAGCDFDEVEDDADKFFEAGEKPIQRVERKDLFGSLVRSALEGDAEGRTLSDREVVGCSFIFTVAGHETTANTLAFTLANLALHPQYQEKILEEIADIEDREGCEVSYQHYSQLHWVLACYNEAIRQFPPVPLIPKVAIKDVSLVSNSTFDSGSSTICIPEGAFVYEDIAGLHYDPKHWPNPLQYDPSRFINDTWDRDAFLPFSAGPRACIGRRFSEVEAVCAIVQIVKAFKLHPAPATGESIERTKERMLKAKLVITLTPIDCPIVFEKR